MVNSKDEEVGNPKQMMSHTTKHYLQSPQVWYYDGGRQAAIYISINPGFRHYLQFTISVCESQNSGKSIVNFASILRDLHG